MRGGAAGEIDGAVEALRKLAGFELGLASNRPLIDAALAAMDIGSL